MVFGLALIILGSGVTTSCFERMHGGETISCFVLVLVI